MLPPGSSKGKSLFVNLLPYLGKTELWQRVDYSDENGAAFLMPISISTYNCPSDPTPRVITITVGKSAKPVAGANYSACSGVWLGDAGFNGLFRTLKRTSYYDSGPVTVAQITDGMANTAAVSEIRRANGVSRRLTVAWQTPKGFGKGELEALCAVCAGLPADPSAFGWRGSPWRGLRWFEADYSATLYNHALTPDNPTCLNGNAVLSALSTATSYHPGAVNLLYGDGHIGQVDRGIDILVWRRLGGRDDGS
jgi:prepilin-type processing-associated H-X9-DG protein